MTIRLGKHVARIEDNILFFYLFGDLETNELLEYIQLTSRIISVHGSFSIADDLSHFGTAAPTVRRTVVDWLRTAPCRGVVLYGGSIAARTLVTLMLGAMKLIGTLKFPAAIVRNEQEARDWLATHQNSDAATN